MFSLVEGRLNEMGEREGEREGGRGRGREGEREGGGEKPFYLQ